MKTCSMTNIRSDDDDDKTVELDIEGDKEACNVAGPGGEPVLWDERRGSTGRRYRQRQSRDEVGKGKDNREQEVERDNNLRRRQSLYRGYRRSYRDHSRGNPSRGGNKCNIGIDGYRGHHTYNCHNKSHGYYGRGHPTIFGYGGGHLYRRRGLGIGRKTFSCRKRDEVGKGKNNREPEGENHLRRRQSLYREYRGSNRGHSHGPPSRGGNKCNIGIDGYRGLHTYNYHNKSPGYYGRGQHTVFGHGGGHLYRRAGLGRKTFSCRDKYSNTIDKQHSEDLLQFEPHAYNTFLNDLPQIIEGREYAKREQNPNRTVLINEARVCSPSESSIGHQSSNHRDTHVHHCASTVQSFTSELYNTSASGSIVASPSDESLLFNTTDDVRMEIEDNSYYVLEDQRVTDLRPQDTEKQNTAKRKMQTYKMTSMPRGFLLIINNKFFSDGEDRPGSQFDVERINELFTRLGFLVYAEEDKTAEEMTDLLYDVSNFQNLVEVDSLIVVIMSHGNDGHIMGIDGNRLEIKKLVKLFDGDNCPAMIGKPKMFIFNACRGDQKPTMNGAKNRLKNTNEIEKLSATYYKPPAVNAKIKIDDDMKLGSTSPCFDKCNTDHGSSTLTSQIPPQTDFVLAYSTFPGNGSYRDKNEGSWYVQCLVDVFNEMAADEHVMDLLTMVTKRVADMNEKEKGFKQTPFPSTSLRYKWFLNPPESFEKLP